MTADPRSPAALLDLIGAFYDCALDPALWPQTCERLTHLMDGHHTAISLHDTTTNQVSVRASWNVDPALEDVMKRNFAVNPLVPSAWYMEIDQPFSSLGVLGEQEFNEGRFYREIIAPFNVGDSALALLARSVRKFGAVSIQRLRDQSPYTNAELATLGALAPHIRRAVMIADLLDVRALERNALAATLDLMSAGVVLTDKRGRIAFVNHTCRMWIEQGAALKRRGDFISAIDPGSASDLETAIEDAASGPKINIPRSGIVVPLKGEGDGDDLAAWVLPLDGGLRRELGVGFSASVAVFIRQLGTAAPFPAELFVRRFGITQAECRVMMLLTQGMSVTEAAAMLGISIATARTHLAHLFDKTGTRRQAELVGLVISALTPVSDDQLGPDP